MLARHACRVVRVTGTDFDGDYTSSNAYNSVNWTWYHATEWQTFPHVTFSFWSAHEVQPSAETLIGFHVSIPVVGTGANVAIQYTISPSQRVGFSNVRRLQQDDSHVGQNLRRELNNPPHGEANRRKYLVFAEAFFGYWLSHVPAHPTVAATPPSNASALASKPPSAGGSIRSGGSKTSGGSKFRP